MALLSRLFPMFRSFLSPFSFVVVVVKPAKPSAELLRRVRSCPQCITYLYQQGSGIRGLGFTGRCSNCDQRKLPRSSIDLLCCEFIYIKALEKYNQPMEAQYNDSIARARHCKLSCHRLMVFLGWKAPVIIQERILGSLHSTV